MLPAFALAYLVAAPTGALAGGIGQCSRRWARMVVAAGWWVALVELWPASTPAVHRRLADNSILELTLGYNGLGRLTGDEAGSVGPGGGAGGAGMWGETGLTRHVQRRASAARSPG